MADDLADLRLRLTANFDRFNSGVERGKRNFDRQARGIEARADRLDNRLSRVGSGFGSRRGRLASFGNVGQQIQDVAVQAEMGTSALRIFGQQGPQILGAFGPVGAMLGAVAAVGASVAAAFIFSGDSAEEAAEKTEGYTMQLGGLHSGMSALEQVARDYAQAVKDAGETQLSMSGNVLEATEAEYNARKALLELEVDAARKRQADRAARLVAIRAELANDPALKPLQLKGARAGGAAAVKKRREAQIAEFAPVKEKLLAELKEIEATVVLVDSALDRTGETLSTSFADAVANAKSELFKGRSKKEAVDFVALGQEAIRSMELEGQAINRTALENARLESRQRAARLEKKLLTAAARDGTKATEEEREQIEALISKYLRVADAAAIATEAEKLRLKALKDQEQQTKKIEEANKRMNESFDRGITNSIAQAKSFKDALRAVTQQLITMASQSFLKGFSGGNSGIGSIFNGVFSDAGSGLAGLFQGSSEGGGFTGKGSRSGGIDGRGGMPWIVHPNETIVDHTKPTSQAVMGQAAPNVYVTINGDIGDFIDFRIAGAGKVINDQRDASFAGRMSVAQREFDMNTQ